MERRGKEWEQTQTCVLRFRISRVEKQTLNHPKSSDRGRDGEIPWTALTPHREKNELNIAELKLPPRQIVLSLHAPAYSHVLQRTVQVTAESGM